MQKAARSTWMVSPSVKPVMLAMAGLALAGWLGCGTGPAGSDAANAPAQAGPGDGAQASGPAKGGAAGKHKLPDAPPTTARGVLEAMVAAYKLAPCYADAGELRLFRKSGEDARSEEHNFAVTLVRPNKLRMEVYRAKVLCDGKTMHAAVGYLPQQVLKLDAPAELTLQSVCVNELLTQALLEGPAGGAPQLLLLLHEDPLAQLLDDSATSKLLEPGKIDGRDCYRVGVTWSHGKGVFWVDQKDYVLRRIEFPTDELARQLASEGPVDELSVVADFHGAQLGGAVDEKAFAFEAPPGARLVKYFIPPDPRLVPDPANLLDKPAPEFKFTDLAGGAITPKQIEGRVAYVDFWGIQCEPCRQSLPKLEKVFQKYKDNPKVTFLAVCVDPPAVRNKELEEVFAGLGVSIPIARDPEGHAGQHFALQVIPTSFLIGPDGRVQDYQIGLHPNVEVDLPAKIDALLAGQDVCQAALAELGERVQKYEAALAQAVEGASPDGAVVPDYSTPRARVAPKSGPAVLKLSLLWKSNGAAAPGGLLVAPRAGAPPRILVVDGFKKAVELGPDGKPLAAHDLALQQDEIVTSLFTAVDAGQTRLFGAVGVKQLRVHVYDEDFKPLLHFPDDALRNPHAGIYDAQLADLDGDGRLDLFVGYCDAVGVQCADLKGERKWAYRQIANVARLAVGGPDAQGKRLLWCAHDRGSLVGLDAAGHAQGELRLHNRPLYAVFAEDLTADGQPEWCGVALLEPGRTAVVGFNLRGEELWTYEAPLDFEPVAAGRLTPSGPGQWIIPGADGSIHVLGPDGKLIDKFNYGARLTGIATAVIGGQPALLVSTPQGVDAWRVE